jgi:hypothetical protein
MPNANANANNANANAIGEGRGPTAWGAHTPHRNAGMQMQIPHPRKIVKA